MNLIYIAVRLYLTVRYIWNNVNYVWWFSQNTTITTTANNNKWKCFSSRVPFALLVRNNNNIVESHLRLIKSYRPRAIHIVGTQYWWRRPSSLHEFLFITETSHPRAAPPSDDGFWWKIFGNWQVFYYLLLNFVHSYLYSISHLFSLRAFIDNELI